jgi:hypothetical protein
MKKGRSFLAVGAFIMSFSTVFGQGDYAFKVLANKGTNEIKSGDTWMAVKTGASLKKEDEIKLAENSYIGLVSVGGKPLELKASGSYKVVDLLSKVQSGSTSVVNKYTDFILSSNSAEAKKNRLSATGAVHRGTPGESKPLLVYLPDNTTKTNIFNNIAIIGWEKANGPYIVTLKNMFEEDLEVIETPETSVEIDLASAKLAPEHTIIVEVKSKTDHKLKSNAHIIKKLGATQSEAIKKELAQVNSDVSEETALNKFILAGFYEEHNLYIDAMTAYEQAIKMAPDVPSYKEAYDEFLLRNNLKTEAK